MSLFLCSAPASFNLPNYMPTLVSRAVATSSGMHITALIALAYVAGTVAPARNASISIELNSFDKRDVSEVSANVRSKSRTQRMPGVPLTFLDVPCWC